MVSGAPAENRTTRSLTLVPVASATTIQYSVPACASNVTREVRSLADTSSLQVTGDRSSGGEPAYTPSTVSAYCVRAVSTATGPSAAGA